VPEQHRHRHQVAGLHDCLPEALQRERGRVGQLAADRQDVVQCFVEIAERYTSATERLTVLSFVEAG